MFSTDRKITTLRQATAQAILQVTPELMTVLQSGKSPKGNALEIARTAGIMAAKKTSELIPFCHPLPLDQVHIEYDLKDTAVTITCRVTAVWKTGVEMEALIGAQLTATTLYDMLKPIDTAMTITAIKVLEKTGGKTSFVEKIPKNFRVAVIVTSDGTHQGTRQDRSGTIIQARLRQYGIEATRYLILPDEREQIRQALLQFCQEGYHLVLTTGGTGLGPRDVTVEATQAVIEREVPGIMEAARSFGQQRTPYAMLSRGLSGLKGNTLIVNLPGSSKGTEESLDAIFPAILHGYKMMAGGGHT